MTTDSAIEAMAHALGTTHDPSPEECEEARALLIRMARALTSRSAEGDGQILADAERVLAAFGAERLPR